MNKLVDKVPDGYALVSIDALKAWGKYDEVRNACQFQAEQAEQEPEVWYCPDCGTLSELQVKCCPDWIRSRKVPKNFALTCKATFDRNGQAEQQPLMITPGGGAFPFAVVGELEQAEQELVDGVLPCPFCGDNQPTVFEGSTFRWRVAVCNNCGAYAPEVRHDTLAEDQKQAGIESDAAAITAWNTRAAPVEPVEQEPVAIGSEWKPCMKLPVVVHVREQREGESHVSTREGITPVRPDDLIMRGVAGEEYPIGRELFNKTYTFDTAAPVQQAEQEPVAIVVCNRFGVISLQRPDGSNFNLGKNVGMKFYTAPQPVKQEPVAWAYIDSDGSFMDALDRQHGAYQTPLYAAPVRTKDLTDDEIAQAVGSPLDEVYLADFRAVIAADMEKNK